MKKAPVSICMITRGDPHIKLTLQSVRDYVEEICVVITTTDPNEPALQCLGLIDKHIVFTDCNDSQDRISDFSLARNKSLELATQPWLMWIDSDDTVSGLENLNALIADIKTQEPVCFLFPYEYSYDQDEKVTCLHWRERLFNSKTFFQFKNPIHEVLAPQTPVTPFTTDLVVVKHQRQRYVKAIDPERNLRILKNYFEQGGTDPRNMYYIGLEYCNNNDIPNGIKYLTEYIPASGWSDEAAMACLKLIDIYQTQNDLPNALKYAFKCLDIKHNWFESYYSLCRVYFYMHDWEKAIHYGQLAINAPPTKTLLFVDESARYEVYKFLNVAYSNVGNFQAALNACNAGLAGKPNEPALLNNKEMYERFFLLQQPQDMLSAAEGKLSIVFVIGNGPEYWTPKTAKKNGIGGSETMAIAQAKNLAALGHTVRVYASCDGMFDNVEYINVSKYGNIKCDILVVSRYAPYLSDTYVVNARLKLLWVHDVCAINATNELLLKADKILALSEWHKNNLVKTHNLHPDHVITTRNGIDLNRFAKKVKRDCYKCVNSSSPDRSWEVLLDCWPEIKRQVPKATLHLYYGFLNWKVMANGNHQQLQLIAHLEEKIKHTEGVVFHNRVSQAELAKEFLSAGVWVYPTWFSETSCITAMEAQAAGLQIITSNIAALAETVKVGTLLDGDSYSEEYKDAFIKSTVIAMNRCKLTKTGIRFDIKALAVEWQTMFYDLLQTKSIHPINKYQPTKPYTRTICNEVKLNIAAGPNVFPFDGWLNYDHINFEQYFGFIRTVNNCNGMPDHQRQLWQYVQDGGQINFLQQNMTDPFNHNDNSVDFIYVGQAIEHLSPIQQVPQFLKECYRMLKNNAVLRMTTPDLDILIDAYKKNEMDRFDDDQPPYYKNASQSAKLSYIMFGAGGEQCNQSNYEGHFNLFTKESLTIALQAVGFKNITFNPPVRPEIRDEGLSHSLCVEATK